MKARFVSLTVFAVVLAAATAPALAGNTETTSQDMHWGESPLWGTWSFNFGIMFFADENYQDIYGDKGMTFYNMNASWKMIDDFELLGSIGYGWQQGHGISPADDSGTAEKYKLHIAPAGLGLAYRFNFVLDQPVVPYLGAQGLFSYWFEERLDSSWKRKSYNYGATGIAGVMFLLDNLEKRASGLLESQWGINNSYLFYEYRYTSLDNFGEEDVVDLSSQFHSLGVMLEF